MSGRPVRRRVLADVARTGGWQAVLARIASGEKIVAIVRSASPLGSSRGFFTKTGVVTSWSLRRGDGRARHSRRLLCCSVDSHFRPPLWRGGPSRQRPNNAKKVVRRDGVVGRHFRTRRP